MILQRYYNVLSQLQARYRTASYRTDILLPLRPSSTASTSGSDDRKWEESATLVNSMAYRAAQISCLEARFIPFSCTMHLFLPIRHSFLHSFLPCEYRR